MPQVEQRTVSFSIEIICVALELMNPAPLSRRATAINPSRVGFVRGAAHPLGCGVNSGGLGWSDQPYPSEGYSKQMRWEGVARAPVYCCAQGRYDSDHANNNHGASVIGPSPLRPVRRPELHRTNCVRGLYAEWPPGAHCRILTEGEMLAGGGLQRLAPARPETRLPDLCQLRRRRVIESDRTNLEMQRAAPCATEAARNFKLSDEGVDYLRMGGPLGSLVCFSRVSHNDRDVPALVSRVNRPG